MIVPPYIYRLYNSHGSLMKWFDSLEKAMIECAKAGNAGTRIAVYKHQNSFLNEPAIKDEPCEPVS